MILKLHLKEIIKTNHMQLKSIISCRVFVKGGYSRTMNPKQGPLIMLSLWPSHYVYQELIYNVIVPAF